jgi:hypothetical protein
MMRALDLNGRTFGKLTVLRQAEGRTNAGGFHWWVRCTCGLEKIVSTASLVHANTKSCGARMCARPPLLPNNLVSCACGCGIEFLQFGPGRRSRSRTWVFGHWANRWTAKNDRQLRKLYRTMSVDALAKLLGHPSQAVYTRAFKIGITGRKSEELESLAQAAERVGRSTKWIKRNLLRQGIRVGQVPGEGKQRDAFVRVNRRDLDRVMAKAKPMGRRQFHLRFHEGAA